MRQPWEVTASTPPPERAVPVMVSRAGDLVVSLHAHDDCDALPAPQEDDLVAAFGKPKQLG